VTRKIGEIIRAFGYERDWGDGANSHRAQASKAGIRFMACRIRVFRTIRTHRTIALQRSGQSAAIMSAVLASQSKPAMIAFLDLDWRRNYPDESLNTGVSFRKDDSGSNLGE
jgi:hypothetical protein